MHGARRRGARGRGRRRQDRGAALRRRRRLAGGGRLRRILRSAVGWLCGRPHRGDPAQLLAPGARRTTWRWRWRWHARLSAAAPRAAAVRHLARHARGRLPLDSELVGRGRVAPPRRCSHEAPTAFTRPRRRRQRRHHRGARAGAHGAGHRVLVAHDAVRAYELVRAERPAVLLTDIMLGVTSGLDLITRVRSDLAPPLPVIIAMSGFSDVAGEALRAGLRASCPSRSARGSPRGGSDRHRRAGGERGRRASRGSRSAPRPRRGGRGGERGAGAHGAAARGALAAHRAGRCEWLPGYLGFGHAFVAMLQDGRLRAVAASAGAPVDRRRGGRRRVPLVRDIAETASSMVLPGKDAPASAGGRLLRRRAAARRLRSPSAPSVWSTSSRARCRRRIRGLQSFGRRASKVLADGGIDMVGAMWARRACCARDAFAVHLVGAVAPLSEQRGRVPRAVVRLCGGTACVADALARRSWERSRGGGRFRRPTVRRHRGRRAAPRRRVGGVGDGAWRRRAWAWYRWIATLCGGSPRRG